MRRAAQASCDFYLDQTPTCGIPYWDTGAPGLARLPDHLDRPADPTTTTNRSTAPRPPSAPRGCCDWDSTCRRHGESAAGHRYWQAGLTVARTLLGPPYLSAAPGSPGPAAARHLSSPPRLGPHPARKPRAARRIRHVG